MIETCKYREAIEKASQCTVLQASTPTWPGSTTWQQGSVVAARYMWMLFESQRFGSSGIPSRCYDETS